MDDKTLRPETMVVHAGWKFDPQTGAVMPPIYQVSTYAQPAPGEALGYEYSRTDNPTRTPLQKALAALEHADYALAFASGLAAIDAVLNTLKSGDRVVAGDDLYGGTFRIFARVAVDRGIDFSYVDLSDPENLVSAIDGRTKLVWFETPTNPMLKLVDIEAVAKIAHARGVLVAVDNTFMSPMFQNPLDLGADLVMHSMTKYINGHSDVVMGCLMLNDPTLYERLKFLQNAIGAVPAPMDCFLALRGIRTLAVRMRAHQDGAIAVANWLETHPRVKRVLFPGLKSHPDYGLAQRQTRGNSGMISFDLDGDIADSRRFLGELKLFKLAESLGGVESLIELPAIMTHASVPAEQRTSLGITDTLVRISVGIEHPEDLIADLSQALGQLA